MSGFTATWLALREPVDHRARAASLLHRAAALVADHPAPRLLDLGSGTGSTVRALSPLLGPGQRWRLTDHDAELLARAAAAGTGRPGEPGPEAVETLKADLNALPDAALDEVDLVTTSAFLDLVSAAWLDAFADRLAAHRLPFYAALTYDGRIELAPAHPLDASVSEAVNRHQLGDKGFGPALGPAAAAHAAHSLRARGFEVHEAQSDWVPEAGERAFQDMLVDGWAQAALELCEGRQDRAEVEGWRAARKAAIAAGASRIRVGHVDLLALPPRER